jgi:LuxR family maltose regulon positive regulatory protein
MYAVQGLLNRSYETYQSTAQSIPKTSGEHRGARALLEIGIADVSCERNDLDAALAHIEHGLALLPWWDKADDWVLAYITLARIHLARADMREAIDAVEKASQHIRTRGTFSEARHAAEVGQVKLWLAQGDLRAATRWLVSQADRSDSDDQFGFECELTHIAQARVLIAQNKPDEAIDLLSRLEETARSAGRMGRVIEILLLKALALQEIDDSEHAMLVLTEGLALAEPESYTRIFLDEGQPMQVLLAQWLAHASENPLREYAGRLLSQFDTGPLIAAVQEKASPSGDLIEPLTDRELEVLHLIALGSTNKAIAQQLFIAPGTVKAHTASIYRKLDVANRTEAAARARQLGLLS